MKGMNAKENAGKRINYIDAVKGIGIIEVVFGHVTSIGNPVDRWFGTHKLAIFFVIAGWLMAYKGVTGTERMGQIVRKKFSSLIIPYLSFSVITILYQVMVALFQGSSLNAIAFDVLKNLYITLSGRGISALWFLTAMFLAEILFYLILKCKVFIRVISTFVAVAVSLLASYGLEQLEVLFAGTKYTVISMPILTVARGIVGFFFLCMGYWAFKLMKRLQNRKLRLGIGVALFAVNIYLSIVVKGSIDLNNMNLSNTPLLFFVGGVIGSLGWILILEVLERYSSYPVLSWCGRNSLIIMATHGVLGFKSIMVQGWAATVSLSDKACLKYYVECIMIVFYVFIFEYGVVEFVNRKAAFLLGKNVRAGNEEEVHNG